MTCSSSESTLEHLGTGDVVGIKRLLRACWTTALVLGLLAAGTAGSCAAAVRGDLKNAVPASSVSADAASLLLVGMLLLSAALTPFATARQARSSVPARRIRSEVPAPARRSRSPLPARRVRQDPPSASPSRSGLERRGRHRG